MIRGTVLQVGDVAHGSFGFFSEYSEQVLIEENMYYDTI